MADKCNCPEEGLPEWIMSYADMITILMAFFVVMYSMAGDKNPDKQDAVIESLHDRFGPRWIEQLMGLGPGPYVPKDSPLAGIKTGNKSTVKQGDDRKRTKGKVQAVQAQGDHPRVHTLRPGEQAAVGGIIYFEGASSDLSGDALRRLKIAVDEIGGKPQKVEVRGHTTRRRPDPNGPYRDNWDLAYARAKAVMEQLVQLGIDQKRIVLGVSAENEPVSRGADPLAITRSARVEVFMLNEAVEPPIHAADAPQN
jgi:chemotaxis protein MotB